MESRVFKTHFYASFGHLTSSPPHLLPSFQREREREREGEREGHRYRWMDGVFYHTFSVIVEVMLLKDFKTKSVLNFSSFETFT